MRNGFTTGTCAQAAAKGACIMLVNRMRVETVDVTTPGGENLSFELTDQAVTDMSARCAVVKDAGDDPDVTHGARICAEVRFSDAPGISIQGGAGVGRITKPGLSLGVGEWAINPVPRTMIMRELSPFLPHDGGLEVTISVPGGEELAQRTYNPRLGIIGGISIIGTTGIVEPKSLAAYKASLALELDVVKSQGYAGVVFVLGYVGEKFCRETLKINDDVVIRIGDHIGFMLEQCARKKIREVVLIGHIGKLIKVTQGQFNTHYRFGDNRLQPLARYAESCGADKNIIEKIARRKTAEAAADILKEADLTQVFARISRDVSKKCSELVNNEVNVKCVLLSLNGQALGVYPLFPLPLREGSGKGGSSGTRLYRGDGAGGRRICY